MILVEKTDLVTKPPMFDYLKQPLMEPNAGVEWAETMVLNPAMIRDPSTGRIHMLFRASGPWNQARLSGKPSPYPIFLGYASSDDNGKSWDIDWSKPAFAPALEYEADRLLIECLDGVTRVNYTNGLVEDPRLIMLEGKCYMTLAGRLFPSGPYWLDENPLVEKRPECAPDWVFEQDHNLGIAANKNLAVSVVCEVNMEALSARDYENAFDYITHLTDPEGGDNRDVMLFPEKMMIDGKMRYVCLHRPKNAAAFMNDDAYPARPCMFIAAADKLEDFATERATHKFMASPMFDWEAERIGASFPPIKIDDTDWLISYHAKKDAIVGYTQSFMIVRKSENAFPEIIHRCSRRLMYASQKWETDGVFPTPCLFSTGGIVQDGKLMISYGAADTKVGLAACDFNELVDYIRCFDSEGLTLNSECLCLE